jgi:hypothetical protein
MIYFDSPPKSNYVIIIRDSSFLNLLPLNPGTFSEDKEKENATLMTEFVLMGLTHKPEW